MEGTQDLYFEVRRKKLHIFLEAKETTTVEQIKLMINGITKIDTAKMELYKMEDEGKQSLMKDGLILSDCGFSSLNAKAQTPAVIGMRILGEDAEVQIEEVSVPPPLPDNMRQEPVPAE